MWTWWFTLALLALIASVLLTVVSTIRTDEIGQTMLPDTPYDIGHALLPDYRGNVYLEVLSNFVSLLPLVVAFIISRNEERTCLLFILATVYLIRCVTMSVTIMPSSHMLDYKRSFNPFTGAVGGNHDQIFSGHASVMLIGLYFLLRLVRFGRWWVLAATLYALKGIGMILVLRNHYTVDIIIAMIVCLLVIKCYGC